MLFYVILIVSGIYVITRLGESTAPPVPVFCDRIIYKGAVVTFITVFTMLFIELPPRYYEATHAKDPAILVKLVSNDTLPFALS